MVNSQPPTFNFQSQIWELGVRHERGYREKSAFVRDRDPTGAPAATCVVLGLMARLGRFSSGTVTGSSLARMSARWPSYHGGRLSRVPSSSGVSSRQKPIPPFAVNYNRMPPGERTYIEWK